MAVKTFRIQTTTTNNSGDMVESDQTAANRTDGWTSAKLAAAQMAEFDAATKLASGSFSATTKPASFITGTTCNAFSPTSPLTGIFANSAWTFTFALRCTVANAQRGRIRMRVFRADDANGTIGVVELTGATLVGTTVAAALSTTADQTSVITWSPGATITLNNEYLFFVIAWEVTTAGGSNTCDVVIRTGQSAGGSRLVTPDFTATNNWTRAPADSVALSDARTRISQYKRTPADALVLDDDPERVISAKRTPADSLVIADARVLSKGKTRAFADAVALSDARTRAIGRARTLADAVALSDSFSKVQVGSSIWKRNIKVYL